MSQPPSPFNAMDPKRKRPSLDSQHSEPDSSQTAQEKGAAQRQAKRTKRADGTNITLQSTPAYGARVPPSGLTSSKTIRNVETLLRKTIRSAEWRVKQFLQYADKFQVSLTLEGLRVAQTEEGISMKLDQVCAEQLGPDQPSRVFSAKYYTKDDEPLFFYLGQRWTDRQPCGDIVYDIQDQYHLATLTDLEEGIQANRKHTCDGIHAGVLIRYNLATEKLYSVLHPLEIANGANSDNPSRLTHYRPKESMGSTANTQDKHGVIHLVHGWTQEEQPNNQELNPSSSVVQGRVAISCWFRATKVVSLTLQVMFHALFPEIYEKFQAAFDAGVWLREDPGPWLGRAIVYKLQVSMHIDQQDLNPTASFPCGSFTGGEMLVPQFPTKFSYHPGHVCIFRSADLWHKVAHWEPSEPTCVDGPTPGRIGSISFFPQESFDILKDRKPG